MVSLGSSKFDRRNTKRHRFLCLDLSSKRNTTLVLVGGTLLCVVLLTARYRLAHPDDHPYGSAGSSIGAQSYAPSFHWAVRPTLAAGESDKAAESGSGDYDDDYDYETGDGWLDEPQDWLTALTATKWDPQANNSRPLTELTVKSCVLPPGLYDLCAPVSSKKEDALRGKWVRVDKDINRRVGIYYLYLFERRLLPNSQAPVITNITLLTRAPTGSDLPAAESGVWVEVSESIRTGVWPRMATPMFLHYRLTEQSAVLAARKSSAANHAGDLEPITEIDVLYGGREVRSMWNYEAMDTFISGGPDDEKAVNLAAGSGTRFGSRLAVRRTSTAVPQASTLRFSDEGKFTILQAADLHFSVGPGDCRDLDPERERACKKLGADQYSLEWLKAAISESKPDLIVFSGDQLNGQDTSWSAASTILKWAPVIWDLKLPWTVIFGNHDAEQTELDLAGQMALLQAMPYFIGEPGPGVGGTGNYMRSIKSADASDTTLFNLYFLDSHANVKSLNPFGEKGYDFIKPAQINWFKGKSSRVSPFRRPYAVPPRAVSRPSRPKTRPSRPKPVAVDKEPDTWGGAAANKAAAYLRKPKLKPTADEIEFTAVSDGMRKRVKRQWGAGEEEDAAAESDDQEFDDEEDDTVEMAAEGGPAYGDSAQTSAMGGQGKGYSGAGKASKPAADYDDEYDTDTKAGKLGSAYEDEASTGTSDTATNKLGIAYGEDDVGDASNELETPAKQVKPEPIMALDPFEDEDEMYDTTPTVLPAGPTKATPMNAKPNAMAFFHIPLQESYDAPIDVGADGKRLLVGERFEGNGASKTNSGMFDTGILHQGELLAADAEVKDEFWEGEFSAPTSGRPEVKVVANGHCHVSEDCRRVKGVWLCFGGGASYSGYGKAGFARRMRVYTISDYGERVATHHLMDDMKRDHEIVLVGEDAMGESR